MRTLIVLTRAFLLTSSWLAATTAVTSAGSETRAERSVFAAGSETRAERGRISGVVVNGTVGGKPLAGAEVILRAGGSDGFEPIASTTTDKNGQFVFGNLAINERVIFLPGANRHDVHFPGPRLRLDELHPTAEIELVAYNSVESPSPLMVRRHDISVRVETGFMEITEDLTIDNPSRTAYVGEAQEDRLPITLRLQLPAGFETVTFTQEFLGRSFLIHDNQLVTDLPWPPGTRDVKFVYRLPVEQRFSVFRRVLDLPTEHVAIRVTGQDPQRIACNLPSASADRDGEVVYAQQGTTLQAGHSVELRMGDLPVRWETYARWGAVVVLGLLLTGTLARNRWGRRGPTSSSPTPRTRGSVRHARRSLPVGPSP